MSDFNANLAALLAILERDHLVVTDIENDAAWPVNAHVIDTIAQAQSLTRELEEAKEVRDAMGAWAVQFLATDPAVGSVEAAAPYVQEIIRKNRAELRSIRAAKVGVDLSRDRSDSTETEAPGE